MNAHMSGVVPCLAIAMTLLSMGCHRAQHQAEQASAQSAVNEDAARQAVATFDDAVARQDWHLAKAQADVLLAQYPATQAAQRVRSQFDEVKAKADAARETARTAALWNYNREPVKGGTQVSASINAKDDVDVDGSGAKPVQLVFRDHPSWGRSAYLVLQAGDFNCYRGCKVKVRIDNTAPKAMAASRPKTDEAIAMFIEDHRGLWRMTKGAKLMAIEFPVKAGGTRTAVFEVGGVERSRMPGRD